MFNAQVLRGERASRAQQIGYASILRAYRQAVAKLNASDMYSDDYKRAQQAKLQAEALSDLDSLGEMIQRDIAEVRASGQRGLAKPAADAVSLLREMQTAHRLDRRLAAGSSVVDLASEYGAAGDVDTLRVLRAEAPSILAAGGASVGQIADTLTTIDAAIRPHLTPTEQSSMRVIDEAEWADHAHKVNHSLATGEVQGEGATTVLVDGAVRKGTIQIGTGWEA